MQDSANTCQLQTCHYTKSQTARLSACQDWEPEFKTARKCRTRVAQVGQSVPLHLYNITQVELAATVFVAEGKPPKTVNIRITHPNSCSLKYDEIDLSLRQMLEASGIEPQAPARMAGADAAASTASAE